MTTVDVNELYELGQKQLRQRKYAKAYISLTEVRTVRAGVI